MTSKVLAEAINLAKSARLSTIVICCVGWAFPRGRALRVTGVFNLAAMTMDAAVGDSRFCYYLYLLNHVKPRERFMQGFVLTSVGLRGTHSR